MNYSSFGVLGFQWRRQSAVMFSAWMRSFWKWFQSQFSLCFFFIPLLQRLVSTHNMCFFLFPIFISTSCHLHICASDFVKVFIFSYQTEEERLQQENEKKVSAWVDMSIYRVFSSVCDYSFNLIQSILHSVWTVGYY